jgi:hypothetical protein
MFFLSFIGCKPNLALELEQAEEHYVKNVFKYGMPQGGHLRLEQGDPSQWTAIHALWFDSISGQYFEEIYSRRGQQVYLDSMGSAQPRAAVLKEDIQRSKGELIGLDLVDQQATLFLPLQFFGLNFFQWFDDTTSLEKTFYHYQDCDRSSKVRVCLSDGTHDVELSLFGTRDKRRIRTLKISPLSKLEALAYLDTLNDVLGCFPEPVSWIAYARKPVIHNRFVGDLYSFRASYQSPFPVFRLIFSYAELGGELRVKLENCREDYAKKIRILPKCAFVDGNDYYCEFLNQTSFDAKLANAKLANAKTSNP